MYEEGAFFSPSHKPFSLVIRVRKIVIREIMAHWQLRHPNIVAVIGIHQFDEDSFPSMILQYAEHSSVIEYLELHPDSRSFLKLARFYLAYCQMHVHR